MKKIVLDAKDRYKENFCVDGLIYANNPARLDYIKKPAFAREGYLSTCCSINWF